MRLGSLVSEIGDVTHSISNSVSQSLLSALERLCRISKFGADRAGALACKDVNAAIRVMAKWAGMPLNY